MPTLHDLTSFDLAIAGMALVFLIRGAWIGCLRQLGVFLALVGSYWLAGHSVDRVLPLTQQWVTNPKLVFLVSFVCVFAVAVLVLRLMGGLVGRLLRNGPPGGLDRLAGLVLGGVKAAVVASLLYMVLASSLSTTNELLRRSFTGPWLKQGAEALQGLINDPRLRQYFLPKEPAILPESGQPGSGKGEPPHPEVQKKEAVKSI